MKAIRLAFNLVLPLDSDTQTFGILAKRRAGKSYLARRLAEQLFRAGRQVVIVDPKGDWWGIRSAANGRDPGLPVVILGGERGDVKLEPNAGEVVAKLVVEERVSALLDMSLLRKNEVATFMTGFLEALYRLKAREANRTPVMLVVDEADAVAPQKPMHGEERMLGAAEDIVRRGGQRGIGCTLITQRSAVLNKNVLTQVQVLIALRTIAPQDLAAMGAWIDVHGTPAQKAELMESLPSLPTGHAWVWSPGWPTDKGIFEQIQVLPIETYDSGATPKHEEKRAEPKHLAEVDLDALKRQMAATIERSKAEDPRELRRRIGELEQELRAGQQRKALPAPKAKEVPVLKDAQVKRLEAAVDHLMEAAQKYVDTGKALLFKGDEMQAALKAARQGYQRAEREARAGGVPDGDGIANVVGAGRPASTSRPAPLVRAPLGNGRGHAPAELTGPEQRILDALAWLDVIGVSMPENAAVAFLAGYTPSGGAYSNPKGRLRAKGLIEYLSEDRLHLTPGGRNGANFPAIPPTTEVLHQSVLARLPGPEQRLLGPLLKAWPRGLSNEELAAKAGYAPAGGAFANPRGRLRTLGLVEYVSGEVRARDILFPSGGGR